MGFMAMDLHLFLNTHPEDKEALAMYNDVVEKGAIARKEYESLCGPLSFGKKSDGWPWIKCPWPWQESFNYKNTSCEAGWSEPYGEERL
jgi:spore coat protein JB